MRVATAGQSCNSANERILATNLQPARRAASHRRMTQVEAARTRTRRMDPALRKGLILDKTAALIAREGVSAVSMERVGREAGVSKALIYIHFPNRTVLLQELLLREQRRLLELQTSAVRGAGSLEDLISLTTRAYLKHVEEDGLYIQRLMSEPSVSVAFRELDRRDRQRAVEFIAKEVTRSLNLPPRVATLATELSMGMTGAAAELVSSGAVSREQAEEILLCLFRGSMASLREQYGKD